MLFRCSWVCRRVVQKMNEGCCFFVCGVCCVVLCGCCELVRIECVFVLLLTILGCVVDGLGEWCFCRMF